MEYFKRQNRREELKKIFDDTFEMMRDNDVLKESIAMSKHLANFMIMRIIKTYLTEKVLIL